MNEQVHRASQRSGRRVVVTGGAGFIGSHVADALHLAGDTVHVVDDLSTGQRSRVHPDVTFHELDISKPGTAEQLAREHGPFDTWYHLAAQADVRISVTQPATDASINVLGTIQVLSAAALDAAQVVFASTGGALYGEVTPPTPETGAVQPESPYGAAKYAAETYIRTWARLYGAPHAILRYANVYGPRQDPHGEAGVVAIFGGRLLDGSAVTIYGDGTATRDYVFVTDVVNSTLSAGHHAATRPAHLWRDVPTYNIGTGVETSVLELWQHMQLAAGLEAAHEFAAPRPGELQRSALDATRAHTDLKLPDHTPLDIGLAHTIGWMREQRAIAAP